MTSGERISARPPDIRPTVGNIPTGEAEIDYHFVSPHIHSLY
jgi:hypothetical protein